MTYAAMAFAILAAILHVYIWTMESLTWKQPNTWKRFGLESQEEAEITSPMAYNQGFYNLFLAVGVIVGAVLILTDKETVGWSLVVFGCATMLLAAVVLVSTGWKYLQAAITQGILPFFVLLFAALSTIS